MSLAEKLTVQPARPKVIEECCVLIDKEVASIGGLSGIAIKGAYKMVKAIKPRFVPDVIDALLDEWVAKMEPFFGAWSAAPSGKPFADHVSARPGEVAEALLEVTDERAKKTKHTTVKKMYEKLRPSAKAHVEHAIPGLGALVDSYLK